MVVLIVVHKLEKPQASILPEVDLSVCPGSYYYYYYTTSGVAATLLQHSSRNGVAGAIAVGVGLLAHCFNNSRSGVAGTLLQ